MSRIGKKPIALDKLDSFALQGERRLNFKSGSHELSYELPSSLRFELEDKNLRVAFKKHDRQSSMMAGLHRTLLNNKICGFQQNFKKTIKLGGVGFKVFHKGNFLTLQLGFSHLVKFLIPKDVQVNVIDRTSFEIISHDKYAVGLFAAKIKSVRPVEPYKARGVIIEGDFVLRKSGKSKK